MPRDSNGVYSLPAGNPVVSGTVIASAWANTSMSDLAGALTDSLDRYGRGGMLAPFRFSDGTNVAPGAAWSNEPTTGLYRFDSGDLRLAILTVDKQRWNAQGSQLWNVADSQWEGILTDGGGAGLVPVPPGTADGDKLVWDETTDQAWTVVPAGGGGELPAGAAEGQTLRWDNTDSAWESSNSLIIADNGNVGIGTDSPNQTLTIDSDNAVNCMLRRDGTDVLSLGGDASGAGYVVSRNNALYLISDVLNDSAWMSFLTGGSERVRITNAGAVGIGTTNPSGRFQVLNEAAGGFTANFSGPNRAQAGVVISKATGGTADPFGLIRVQAGNSGDVLINGFGPGGAGAFSVTAGGTITAAGNVGVGVSAPSARVQISGEPNPSVRISSTLPQGDYGLQSVGSSANADKFRIFDYERTRELASFSGASGDFLALGNVTGGSDERYKENWRPVTEDFIERLAGLLSGVYDRTDLDITQAGVGAQSLQRFLPEAVIADSEGFLSVAYGNAAMVSAVELAKRVVLLESRLALLEGS